MTEFTISVEVRPSSKTRSLKYDETRRVFIIHTHKAPEDGKANLDVVDMLSKHFGVPKSAFSIKRGATSRKKVIKIMAP